MTRNRRSGGNDKKKKRTETEKIKKKFKQRPEIRIKSKEFALEIVANNVKRGFAEEIPDGFFVFHGQWYLVKCSKQGETSKIRALQSWFGAELKLSHITDFLIRFDLTIFDLLKEDPRAGLEIIIGLCRKVRERRKRQPLISAQDHDDFAALGFLSNQIYESDDYPELKKAIEAARAPLLSLRLSLDWNKIGGTQQVR